MYDDNNPPQAAASPRFLRVDFGDNDFGIAVEMAASRLWRYILTNNHFGCEEAMPATLAHLCEQGWLHGMLNMLVDLANLELRVETTTRGLTRAIETEEGGKPFCWDGLGYGKYESLTGNYLKLELSLHADTHFAAESNNGESVGVDMLTGAVWIF